MSLQLMRGMNLSGLKSGPLICMLMWFGVARVGGEADSPVRFRLSIKRAEIIVLIPESEPVRVDKRSVSRDSPASKGHLTQVVERALETSAEGAAGIGLSKDKFGGGAKLEVTAKAQQQTNSKLELTTAVELMIVVQSQTADGHYRWTVESPRSSVLVGRPWDANKQPRLKLVDKRKDRSKGIPPTVRVEVRCRREDLNRESRNKGRGIVGFGEAKGRIPKPPSGSGIVHQRQAARGRSRSTQH